MRVSDYMPRLYQYNLEMNEIMDSEDTEFENKIKSDSLKAYKNNFAKIADINGIRQYEKLLNIPLDSNKDNLEYRRNRVISKLTERGLLTYTWLFNNLIELVGADNFNIQLTYNSYTLVINVANIYQNITSMMYAKYRKLIPANMILTINLFETETTSLYIGVVCHEADKTYIIVN